MTSSPGVVSVRLTRQGEGPSAIFRTPPCAASSASDRVKRWENRLNVRARVVRSTDVLRSSSDPGAMTMIRTKSVYSRIDRSKDGLRILATRVRGRGLPARRYNVWMANLARRQGLRYVARDAAI